MKDGLRRRSARVGRCAILARLKREMMRKPAYSENPKLSAGKAVFLRARTRTSSR